MTAELLDIEAKMTAFARRFPCVTNAPGIRLWDANALDRWPSEAPISSGELVTAQFLLMVWDPNHVWATGRFDVTEALRAWDERHRAAFVEWVRDPWWA